MGAALSAAVMPCTRVPVTITVSLPPPLSCANAGAATKAAMDVPIRSDCLKFGLKEVRIGGPPRLRVTWRCARAHLFVGFPRSKGGIDGPLSATAKPGLYLPVEGKS